VIPDSATLKLNLRWFDPKVREQMIQGIKRITDGIATAAGVHKDRMPKYVICRRRRRCWNLRGKGARMIRRKKRRTEEATTPADGEKVAELDDPLPAGSTLRFGKSLRRLDVSGTPISAKALRVVKALPNLEWLDVAGTSIGWWARCRLRLSFPRLRVLTETSRTRTRSIHCCC
jgi:hypothetical protein